MSGRYTLVSVPTLQIYSEPAASDIGKTCSRASFKNRRFICFIRGKSNRQFTALAAPRLLVGEIRVKMVDSGPWAISPLGDNFQHQFAIAASRVYRLLANFGCVISATLNPSFPATQGMPQKGL
jgi:hypothetical protein